MDHDVVVPVKTSQRILERKQRQLEKEQEEKRKEVKTIADAQESDICLGLNELTDALQAFPQGVISYFTLLKEIEAKCIYTVPHLMAYIKRFLAMRKDHPKRGLLLSRIRECIKELMPCLEEKMHVATIANDLVRKYTTRLDQAYDIIVTNEIPEIVRIGPLWEPCMKVSEPKTLQQQRSESRREAIAAKRAKNGDEEYESAVGEDSMGPSKKGVKGKKEKVYQNTQYAGNPHSSNVNVFPNGRKRRNGDVVNEDEYVNAKQVNSNGTRNVSSSNKKTKAIKSSKGVRKESGNGGNNAAPSNGKRKGGGGATDYGDGANARPKTKKEEKVEEETGSREVYEGEPVYCYCQQVSYGEMVGCDGEHCEKEWFHLPCTGLKEPPKGEWYCDECKVKLGIKP